ncbi:hypothetical protein A1D31_35375 [Bradyrhizobium liaoningense]|nr:hypothetical protein A1D31_35375 [Bradyrhizobium liaoningense]
MLAFLRGMLDCENDDFASFFVQPVISQIRVPPRHQLAYALDLLWSPKPRKANEILKRFKDRSTHA